MAKTKKKITRKYCSPISRKEGVTLYSDVKKFNLLKDSKLDYYGDFRGS